MHMQSGNANNSRRSDQPLSRRKKVLVCTQKLSIFERDPLDFKDLSFVIILDVIGTIYVVATGGWPSLEDRLNSR